MTLSISGNFLLTPPATSPFRQMSTHWTNDNKMRILNPKVRTFTDNEIQIPTWGEVFDERYGEGSIEGKTVDQFVQISNDDNFYAQITQDTSGHSRNKSRNLNYIEQAILMMVREITADKQPTSNALAITSLSVFGSLITKPIFTANTIDGSLNLWHHGLLTFAIEDHKPTIKITDKGRKVIIAHEFNWVIASQFPWPPENGKRARSLDFAVLLGNFVDGALSPS